MRTVHNEDWLTRQGTPSHPAHQQDESAHQRTQLLPSDVVAENIERPIARHKRHAQKHGARLSRHSHQTARVRSRLLSLRQDESVLSHPSTFVAIVSSDMQTMDTTITSSSSGTVVRPSSGSEMTSWPANTSFDAYTTPTASSSVSFPYTDVSSTLQVPSTTSARKSPTTTPTRPYTSFTFKPNGTSAIIPGSQSCFTTTSTAAPWDPLISVILSLASVKASASSHSVLTATDNYTSTVTSPSSAVTILPTALTTTSSASTYPYVSSIMPSFTGSSAAGSASPTTFFSSYTLGVTSSTIASTPQSSSTPLNVMTSASSVLSSSKTSGTSSNTGRTTGITSLTTARPSRTTQHFTTMTSPTTSSTTTAVVGTISMPSSASHTTTPTVVGSVVGGVAGISIIVVIAFLLFRWWRGRGNQSTGAISNERPSTPSMTAAFLPSAAAGLFSRLSPGRGEPPAVTAGAVQPRSFERLSGRKLPSQWSPGMEGPQGAFAPSTEPGSGAGNFHSPATSSTNAYGRPSTADNPFLDPVPSYGTIAGAGTTLGAGAATAAGSATHGFIPVSPGRRDVRSSAGMTGVTRFREDIV